MSIKKEDVLNNLEEIKKYVNEIDNEKKEEKVIGIAIKTKLGNLIFQSSKTTMKEAVIERLQSDANLCGADLYGADLYGADLCGANLYCADLYGADLCGANLCGANLCDANLCGADLHCANLYDANLCDANLYGADLRDAELHNAKFYGRGGTKKLTKKQLPDFLNALGFQVKD
jgi:uncharacterized protein YjbI with pentapeptide repeats